MKKKDFLAQYHTKEWYELSKRIKTRDRNTCQMCGRNDKAVSVHHKVYYEERKVWEYSDDELICICDHCHEIVTDSNRSVYKDFLELKKTIKNFGFSDNVLHGIMSHLISIFELLECEELNPDEDKSVHFLTDVIQSTQDYNDLKYLKRLGVYEDGFIKYLYPNLYEDYVSFK